MSTDLIHAALLAQLPIAQPFSFDETADDAVRIWVGDAIGLFKLEIRKSPSEDKRPRLHVFHKAATVWEYYASYCGRIECMDDATDDEKYKLRDDLKCAHYNATMSLMMEAERAGLPCAALFEEHLVCLELLDPIRGNGQLHSLYPVGGFRHPKSICHTWPGCLGAWRYSLHPGMQEAIRQGELAFTQLRVRLLIQDELAVKQRRQIEASQPARDELLDAATPNVAMQRETAPFPLRSPPDGGDLVMKLVAATGGETGIRIVTIGRDKTKSAEQRQCEIFALDKTSVGWNSGRWAGLLGVSEQAVRSTGWWKVDRKRLRAD